MKLYTLLGATIAGSSPAVPGPLVINLDTLASITPGNPTSSTGNDLIFSINAGATTVTYTANNPSTVLNEINALANGNGSALVSEDYGTGLLLLSVTPTLIKDGAGSMISITGANFASATLGTIWIEDVGGGMDSYGVSLTPTFVDSQHMTAVWASDGDGGTPKGTPVMLYYKDSGGNLSNVLWVTLF